MARKDFNQNTQFVRAFHGKGSIAGSKWYALSAIENSNIPKNDAIRIDYGITEEPFSAVHGATKDTFIRLIGTQKLQNDIFDKNDLSGWGWKIKCTDYGITYDCFDGFKGDLLVKNKSIEQLEYYDYSNDKKTKFPK